AHCQTRARAYRRRQRAHAFGRTRPAPVPHRLQQREVALQGGREEGRHRGRTAVGPQRDPRAPRHRRGPARADHGHPPVHRQQPAQALARDGPGGGRPGPCRQARGAPAGLRRGRQGVEEGSGPFQRGAAARPVGPGRTHARPPRPGPGAADRAARGGRQRRQGAAGPIGSL
ncbi:MAG: Transcriptional regulator, MarR family, partial [uncultured Ramlibacter sp.]